MWHSLYGDIGLLRHPPDWISPEQLIYVLRSLLSTLCTFPHELTMQLGTYTLVVCSWLRHVVALAVCCFMGAGVWACRVMAIDWPSGLARGLPFCCIGAVCARGRTAVKQLQSCAARGSQHDCGTC
jgi:hypothetical protein